MPSGEMMNLFFDGQSAIISSGGEFLARGQSFEEDLLLADLGGLPIKHKASTGEEELYRALCLGTRDYVTKCGFRQVVIGLSGGIDSAITAAIAVGALGPDNVMGILMPGDYSSDHSITDAEALARNLGIEYHTIPIKEPFAIIQEGLKEVFSGREADITEENIQARLRGVTLMAISNKLNRLVLTTGNKSELAVGYCTLYGDMCGGLSVINDVPKTWVYRLARWINREQEVIPKHSIEKPPSAELRPDQKDEDSLPPYEVLDDILRRFVEEFQSVQQIAGEGGYEVELVRKWLRQVDLNEYKRRQAAPGLKVTGKAFGIGRRMPVAQKFRHL
jgi:NAD+ synthase (glutamine-hydrolysing)